MFSSFLNPQGGNRARSRSPGARSPQEADDHYSTTDDERKYRKSSRSKYSETESEDDPVRETSRYEERTPVAYRSTKDDRRRSTKAQDDAHGRKPSKYVEEVEPARTGRSRRERDVYEEMETPRTSTTRTNSDPYAAYMRNGDVPGTFPGSRTKPSQYAEVDHFQYAQPDPSGIQYKYNNGGSRQPSYSKAYDAPVVQPAKTSRPSTVSQHKPSNADYDASTEQWSRERRQSYQRERSPNPSGLNAEQMRKSLGRLSTGSVSGASLAPATPYTAGGRPPASPLLEAYKGTYQTISPLPSPLALAVRKRDDDLSDLELSESGESDDEITRQIRALERKKRQLKGQESQDIISPRSSGSKLEAPTKKSRVSSVASSNGSKSVKKKAVSFYDPATDAEKIADALKGNHRAPDIRPLLKILPWLTTDEITSLKNAYKNYAKINGQGINLSKHIKARIPGNLGKVLYATSLGQYESDAYWANCFYQSGASRRELLIESLVGRSNQQIREIKDVFKDKRYDDDLEKCMKSELKADKFRFAILLALEERRMPEGLGIDMRLVHEDGTDLYQALNSPGGETAMIKIVMLRSDDHLREVLRYYETSYRRNFARDMIRKSQNLVGETLAHILNGALNRPMRDAILLHQVIDEFAGPSSSAHPRTPSQLQPKPSAGRAELLISRVVRMHWEPKHMERVKREYEDRYRENVIRAMARDVLGGMKTDEGKAWAGFVIDLMRSNEA